MGLGDRLAAVFRTRSLPVSAGDIEVRPEHSEIQRPVLRLASADESAVGETDYATAEQSLDHRANPPVAQPSGGLDAAPRAPAVVPKFSNVYYETTPREADNRIPDAPLIPQSGIGAEALGRPSTVETQVQRGRPMTTAPVAAGTIPFIEVHLKTVRSVQVEGRAGVAALCRDLGLVTLAQEEMWVVSLDGARNIRAVVPVAKGGFHEVFVATPAILTAVLLTASDRFVVVHNHPSGDLEPTAQDRNLTKSLRAAASACDLMFEDHLIVGPPNLWYSMHEKGLM